MSNKTTTQLNSCTPKTCSCTDLWSISQKFCLQRLSSTTDNNNYSYIKNKKVRARRIAGTYARLYLEIERDGNRKIGDPLKQGRFYWMSLGAFASKTVACTLEDPIVRLASFPKNLIVTASDWFGQGNFWLFQDIAGWHHYYSSYGSAVFFKCINDRNTNNLVPQMKTAINQAPWATKSLPRIKNLKSNSFLVKGFEYVKVFENSLDDPQAKKSAQYGNLLQTAYHEQKMILQPLIYQDERHQDEIDAMGLAGPFAPAVELVFSSSCSIPQVLATGMTPQRPKTVDDPNYVDEYVSRPDSDIVLYNYDSRMKWIKAAAQKFHQLMQDEKVYMHGELTTMAGWYNKADS